MNGLGRYRGGSEFAYGTVEVLGVDVGHGEASAALHELLRKVVANMADALDGDMDAVDRVTPKFGGNSRFDAAADAEGGEGRGVT